LWCFVVAVVAFDDVEIFNEELEVVGGVVEDDVVETVVLVVGQGVGRK
jgi:hypothetical protein